MVCGVNKKGEMADSNWVVADKPDLNSDAKDKKAEEVEYKADLKAAKSCPCPCGDCGGKGKAGPEIQCWHLIWVTGHTKHSDLTHQQQQSLTKAKARSSSCSLPGDGSDDEELEDMNLGDEPTWRPDAVVHMQGWIRKRGGGTSGLFARKSWKLRWFILHDDILRYFKEEITFLNGSNKSLGWVKLDGSCTLTVEPTGKLMHLHTMKRTLTMEPATPEELNNWKQAISSLISRHQTEMLMF